MEFSLAEQPWIPVLTDTGMDQRSLTTVFADDVLDLASGDPLEDAAILRLLIAIATAAASENAAAAQWVQRYADRFDLFSATAPFAQNPDMARFVNLARSTRPLAAQSYALAGNGSTAVNQFHSLSGITFTPAQAARLLLMRQAFSVGGIQAFPGNAYEKVGNVGPGSAKVAVATNRAFVWIDTGRLLDTINHNAALLQNRPLGTFHFSWPDPKQHPPLTVRPAGVLDALTWPARSIYLLPGDPVLEVMICDGMRWPEPKDDTDYTFADEAELIPNAVFEQKTKTAPWSIQGVHIERSPWRQLLTGLAAAAAGPAAAVLANPRTVDTPSGASVRIAGLASYQSRIDGPVTGTFPVPAPGVDIAAVAALVADAFSAHGSYFGSLIYAAGLTSREQSGAITARLSQYAALTRQLETVAAAAARGELSLQETRTQIEAFLSAANAAALHQFRTTHTLAAARVCARKEAPPPEAAAKTKPSRRSKKTAATEKESA